MNCLNPIDKSVNHLSRINLFKQTLIKFNSNVKENDENSVISVSVKRMLSSIQSISKRHSIENTIAVFGDQSLNNSLIESLSKLENIIFNDNCFAETTVLSGLAIAFILTNYLCDIQKAIHIYFKLLLKESITGIKFNEYEIDNNLSLVLDKCLSINDLSKVSIISGLINCSYFTTHLIECETKVFIQIHSHIIKLCSQRLIHQFHVFRLLQHWFRTFKNHIKQIAQKEPNLMDEKSLIENTLDQIDNNWEHPINGVNDCVKLIYILLLESFISLERIKSISSQNNKIESLRTESNELITKQLVQTLQLSFSCKAKYRKLSALIPFSGWKSAFQIDPNLSNQMIKYLSINSLSSAITELYKSIIISMKCDETEEVITNWSQNWLTPISEALKSQNKVIHNNVIAHLLPFTLKNIENSCELIFSNICDSDMAEVALVRVSIDNKIANNSLPPHSWIKKILAHNEEAVREEGLCLLIDERYISDRQKIYDLFKLFLMTNLNIDNPSFRQRIVSKIDQFLSKICISIRDKFLKRGKYDDNDKKAIQFLSNYRDILLTNLIPGASYQRRTTCLLLLESFIVIKSQNNIEFDSYLDSNALHSLILLSVIDKDDKVRKLASNLLIKIYKTNQRIDFEYSTIADIGLKFLDSPRHQESHSGALIFKSLISNFKSFTIDEKVFNSELQIIEFFVKSAQKQLVMAQQNPLNAAKNFPIHGFILALNNCLSYDYLLSFSSEDKFLVIISDCISLCFDCINLMLSQLSQTNVESSPSFQEMCESLEGIINQQKDENEKESCDDISTSNDFQLLLSMCWLNIKESNFLLSNLVEFSEKFTHNMISDDNIKQIGSQIVNVLIKCRHKGVIEASCIALTKYTVSMIRLKTRNIGHIETLKQLLSDSWNCITKSAYISSITRRSAGLAMIIQAILIGESEAFNEGFKLDISLFSLTIDKLISIAKLELPQFVDDKSDLPQTYALHILKSIISTASLSRFTTKTVEFLLPICIKGFTSNIWQIRNASLQLFGSCCNRMLGQRKISNIDQTLCEGSTITCPELFSRYPTLLSVMKLQFAESFTKINEGFLCSELVPILSLFASFSPIGLSETTSDKQIINYLIYLLGNKIWKVRMLSAKALSNLVTINELQNILFQLCSQQNINCNSIHGLLLAVYHLLELKKQLKIDDYDVTRNQFSLLLGKLVNKNLNCEVLKDVYNEIFNSISIPCDEQELNNDLKVCNIAFANNNVNDFLDQILSSVKFNNSDDIRLFAAKALNSKIIELNEMFNNPENSKLIFKLIEILLIILEDEDKTIRVEAENIVPKLMKGNNLISSFNVSTDCLLFWLIQNKSINENDLIEFLFSKLDSVISLDQIFRLQEENKEILFEKEEKNVFAEPLFLLFKVSKCLKLLISTTGKYLRITDKSLTKLVSDSKYCLDHKSILELKTLAHFSIWKLPKLFLSISSLYLRIELYLHFSNQHSIQSHNISSMTHQIEDLQISYRERVRNPSNCDKLNASEITVLLETMNLLMSKFAFLSIINSNALLGHSLLNYEI